MAHSIEVDAVFPKSVGVEIDSSLRTMKDLPENKRALINNHLRDLIKDKRSALARIKDTPGNEAAYVFIGMLFAWDAARISVAGTMEERMTSATVHYKTHDGKMIMGFGSIAVYFFARYRALGGSDPALLETIKHFGVS